MNVHLDLIGPFDLVVLGLFLAIMLVWIVYRTAKLVVSIYTGAG